MKENKNIEKDTLNETDIIREYAIMFSTTLKEAEIACKSFHALYKYLLCVKKKKITVYKLWSMWTQTLKAKRNKHPVTGEYSVIPEREVIRFSMSESLF